MRNQNSCDDGGSCENHIVPVHGSGQERSGTASCHSLTVVDGDPDVGEDVSFSHLLEVQRDLAVGLLSCESLLACLELLLDAGMRLPGFDCGGIYLANTESGGLRLIAHRGLSDAFAAQVKEYPAESPQVQLVTAGKLVYARSADLPPDIGRVIKAEGLQALAVLPINYSGTVIASLNVSSRQNPWIGPSSLVALESLVAQAEGAVKLIRAREELEVRVLERTAELETLNAILKEKSSNLELALNASQAGVSRWHIHSDTLEWDERMRLLYGFENDAPVRCDQLMDRIHPEDRENLLHDIANIDSPGAGDTWNHEFRIQHPALGERWICRLGRVERDSHGKALRAVGINFDITERKQAESAMREWNQTLEKRVAYRTARLHQSEVRLRQLAEATFEGIAISENGIIIDGNPQLARFHGYEIEEMIGRPIIDFVHPESHALVMERIRDDSETTYEFTALRKDGSTFPMEAHACMRNWQGIGTRVTALRDLTEIKQAIARLQSLRTELEHAHRLGLVSEVSAGIIHQIGQPLCSMSANTAAAIGRFRACKVGSCESLPILTDIEADVSRLREAVVRLRALANPGQTIRARCDFNAVIGNVIRILSQEASRRSTRVTTELCSTLPPIECDAVQLSQVVLNLLHNAFDACGARPPENRLVCVKTRSLPDDRIELTVSDSGSGLSPGVPEHLFAPFFTTKEEGLGMGLRLCQTIVRSHGGSIAGTNNPDGGGAVFRVVLPVSPPEDGTRNYTKV